ncbi:DUF6571 family protein [Streptomyces poonensis]|uniref:AG2 protein n=1 Tax=Streptomyces poonensis TaxID=68255 RepID=A0A918QAI8_9ACTN|nr:DUF6571 family protein [Streptomyces poonensis]GGZ39354.1 hypothetical protein GCM10010365_70180 [Streptomyces poonensis]GLJ93090.1 hypothetical protein GCM10017589_57020 [Streptomyces poonensis]
MPTYEQLYHLNLSNLAAAADRWEETSTKFKGLHTAYGDQVTGPFKQAGWTQPALTAGKADNDVRAAQQQFESAHKQAQGIAGVLTSLHTELKKAKDDLHRLADVEAKEQGLHVSATGTVTPRNDLSQDVGARHDPDGQAAIREQQQACDAFVRRIERVLQRAAEADESACWALRRDLGTSKSDFNSKVVTSLDDADATRAAELIKKGDKLTDAELTQLNQLMKANQNDPVFATRYYQQLGQEGSLQLYGQLALQTADASDERKALLQQMQRNMGNTLATATDPDNKPHLSKEWTAELRSLGTQHIKLHDNAMNEGPYGYQLLGGILRYGNYDSDFLTPVAEHITQLHADDPYFFANTKMTMGDPEYGFNPSGKNGSGYDPMNSVLEALGHSPEAATDYFTPPMEKYAEDGTHKGTLSDIDGSSSYLDYLVDKDYEYFPDITGHDPDAAQKSANYFPDALGHALEAAVSGRPYDDADAPVVKHSAEQAALMHQVVEKIGDNPGLISEKDNGPLTAMSDSLGNMTAEYMYDVQKALAGDSVHVPTNGVDAGLRQLNYGSLSAFLGAVGKDPDAYGAISNAQQAVTTELIRGTLSDQSSGDARTTAAQSMVAPGALISGIMEESRSQAVYDEGVAKDEEFNKSLATGDKWIGRIIETGTSRIPIAGDAVGWVVEDIRGATVEHFTRDTKDEKSAEEARNLEEQRETGAQAVKSATLTAARDASLTPDETSRLADATYNQANISYSDGRSRVDGVDN